MFKVYYILHIICLLFVVWNSVATGGFGADGVLNITLWHRKPKKNSWHRWQTSVIL